MGVPGHVRRRRKRDGAGQGSAFRDHRIAQEQIKVDKKRSERQGRGPKLKSWEKRGEESYRDRDARIAREAQEAIEAEEKIAEEDRLAQEKADRALEEELRIYLPVDDIDDSILVVRNRARIPVDYNACALICRHSSLWTPPSQRVQEQRSLAVARKYFSIAHNLTANSLVGVKVHQILMHASGTDDRGGVVAGFKPISNPFSCPPFLTWFNLEFERNRTGRKLNNVVERKTWVVLLLIRGIDGFLTERNRLRELYDHAKQYQIYFRLCFYLESSYGFTRVYELSELLDDTREDEDLVYFRRRWASHARTREPPEDWRDPEQMARWQKRYSPHGDRKRNDIWMLNHAQ